MKTVSSPVEIVVDTFKNHKVLGWICSIVMIVLGLLTSIFPFIASEVAIWAGVAAILVASIAGIVHFCVSSNRNGVVLASGIVGILIVVAFLLFAALWQQNFVPAPTPEEGFQVWYRAFNANLIFWFSYFAGFWGLLAGIWILCSVGNVESGRQGYNIVIGIVSILYGFFACLFPFISTEVAVILTGIYIACFGGYCIYELVR